MRFTVLGLIILVTTATAIAQDLNSNNLAGENIHALRNGILLVQLDSKQNEIYILKKAGKKRLADELEKKQYLKNKAICYAFNSYFDFCPVYYFYKAYADELYHQNFDKVVLLDEQLEPAYKVDLSDTKYYIAELGYHSPDVPKHNLQPMSYKGYSGLFILNDKFTQLTEPFPFAVKERKFLWIKKDAFTMVEQLNDALHTFLATLQLSE